MRPFEVIKKYLVKSYGVEEVVEDYHQATVIYYELERDQGSAELIEQSYITPVECDDVPYQELILASC